MNEWIHCRTVMTTMWCRLALALPLSYTLTTNLLLHCWPVLFIRWRRPSCETQRRLRETSNERTAGLLLYHRNSTVDRVQYNTVQYSTARTTVRSTCSRCSEGDVLNDQLTTQYSECYEGRQVSCVGRQLAVSKCCLRLDDVSLSLKWPTQLTAHASREYRTARVLKVLDWEWQ